MTLTLEFILCVFLFHACSCNLADRVYKTYAGNPCVWLLDTNGGYGCHTNKNGVVGILKRLNESSIEKFLSAQSDDDKMSSFGAYVLVLPEKALSIKKLTEFLKTKPTSASAKVAGVIFTNSAAPPEGFSPTTDTGELFNEDESAYKWNPNGNNLFRQIFYYPLWTLGVNESRDFEEKAAWNENQTSYPFYAAEMTAYMHPQTMENSYLSLSRGTSKPIGGHSTWTPISPVPANSTKPFLLAVTAMDSASLFQLKTIGANEAVTGIVALMAALDALLQPSLTPIADWQKAPVFAWLDAESWGHLGSIEFMNDVKSFNCRKREGVPPYKGSCTDPYSPSLQIENLHLENIHSIIEVKQVGGEDNELYVHQVNHDLSIPAAAAALNVSKRFLQFTDLVLTFRSNFSLRGSSILTVGLPPSCSKGFLKVDTTLAKKSIVIADHYSTFKNKYYRSIFDTLDKVDAKLVCTSATLVARTLSALGRDANVETDAELLNINANCSVVNELLDCIARNTSCALKRLFFPGLTETSSEFPVLYSSVYFPGSYSIHQKFIHDWVFDRVNKSKRVDGNYTECNSDSNCRPEEYCIRSHCQTSATFYHEATNLNVRYVPPEFYSSYYEIINRTLNNSIWTESDWGVGSGGNTLKLFLVTDPAVDYIFLGVAMAECLVTFVIAILVYKFFNVKYKIL